MAGVPSSSRGAQASTQGGSYLLTALAVAPGTTTPFSWALNDGVDVLSLAVATAPLPLVAGVYALTYKLFVPENLAANKAVFGDCSLDSDNVDPSITIGGVPTTFGGNPIFATNGAAIIFYSPANSSMTARVTHDDAVARDCFARAYVQRVA